MAPRNTAPAIIDKLNREMQRVAGLADIKDRAAVQGAELATNTPQEFTRHIQAEVAKWGKLVRDSGMVNN
jgi:tripartite-type tricarboxylate transporter receptor subunit TctC